MATANASLDALRSQSYVQLVDAASGTALVFAANEEDGGTVRGWLETASSDAASTSGRHDPRTRFRVRERRIVEKASDDANGEVMKTYYGFEHAESGLLLQRRQRGSRKLVFCSTKFGVNEQFDATEGERGSLKLINRRCFGAWEVILKALETPAEVSARKESFQEHWHAATEKAVTHGFGAMENLVRTFQKARDGHEHELTHLNNVIIRAMRQKRDHKIAYRVFFAWRNSTMKSKSYNISVRRAGAFLGERIVMTVRNVFDEWRERCDRKKRMVLKADERYQKIRIRFLREYFFEWKNRLSRDKWCRLAVQRCLKKSERQMKLAVLSVWKSDVDKSKVDREKKRRAERMMLEMMNHKLYSAFYSWRDAVTQSRMNDAKARQSVAKLSTRLIFKAFVEWRLVVDTARAEAMEGKKAITWFLCSTQRRVFTQWVGVARESKRLQRMAARFITRRTSLQLCNAFYEWKEMLHRSSVYKVAMEKAIRRWQQRRLAKAFAQWSEVVEHKKYVRVQAHKMAEKMRINSSTAALSMCFWGWLSIAQESRNVRVTEQLANELLEQRLDIFCKIHATRKARAAFVYWYKYAMSQRDQRLKLTLALNRMTSRLQFTAFNTWVQVVEDRKRQRELMRTVLMRASNRLISCAFNAWREVTADSIAAKIHLKNIENIVNLQAKNAAKERLKRTFLQWKDYAVHTRRQRRGVGKAITSIRKQAQAKAFARWRASAKIFAQQRRTLVRVTQKMQRNNLRMAFDTWAERVDEAKVHRVIFQKAIQKMSQCKLYYAFSGWVARVGEKKTQRALLNRAVSRFRGRRLHVAFYDWASTAAALRHQRQVIERVVSRIRNRLLAGAFEQWKQRASEQRIDRWKMDRALTRLTQRVIFTAFNTWLDHVQTKKRYQAIIGRFYERFRDRSLRGTFKTWVHATQEAKMRRMADMKQEQLRSNKLAQILGSVKRQSLGYAFMQWRDHVQEIKQMKVNESKARGVLARARMRAVARAFNRWVFFIDERRRVMDAAHMVILRVKQRHLAYAFDGWLDAVHKKKRNRLLVANSLRKMRYRITVRAFYSWIESVDEARASRAYERRIERAVKMSLTKVLNRTLSRAFNAWNYKMIEQKRHRTLVSKSLHRARNKTLAQAFDGWSTHVLMIRRQKELVSTSLQRMRRRALVKAFNSWSGYMKQIRSFRVVERRLQNVERAIAPLHVTHSSVSDMVRVNVAMRWGLARNERIYRNPMFMAWVRYSQRISEHRNRTVKKMHDILADRARRKFLRSWRQFTEVMKYHRLKTEHRQKRVVRKIFSEWKMNARSPSGAQETYSLTKYERPTISTGWDFDKSYEENIRLLGRNRVASKEFAYGSRYSTPTASPRTMPTVVEPDSYEKQYRAVMSDVQTMEAEVEALSTVRESLQDQFDLLARDEALRATFARATSASVSLLEQTKSTYYSDRRFSEPFSPVKVSRQPPR